MKVERHIARAIRTRSPFIARSLLTGRSAHAQMADDFRTMVVTAGAICNEDLLVIGWTQAQINAHGAAARTRAIEASVR